MIHRLICRNAAATMRALIASGMVVSYTSPGERLCLLAASGAIVTWRDDGTVTVSACDAAVIASIADLLHAAAASQ